MNTTEPTAFRAPVDLAKATRLMNHGPTVLISAAHAGRRNIMAAAWSMPLDFSPPKVAVVIDKATYTRELIEASGCFALNLPCVNQAAATLAVGGSSGRDGDKFERFGLASFPASTMDVPLLEGCVAWLECRVLREPHNESRYDLFLGEATAAWADPRVFSEGHWQPRSPAEGLRTLHYIAGGHFFRTGDSFEVAPLPPRQA